MVAQTERSLSGPKWIQFLFGKSEVYQYANRKLFVFLSRFLFFQLGVFLNEKFILTLGKLRPSFKMFGLLPFLHLSDFRVDGGNFVLLGAPLQVSERCRNGKR